MPFTFSHPAIVLPLLKNRHKYFSATGLIVGSIIPDFEAFVRIGRHKIYSHTWPGIFWFDLPFALAIAFIFHLLVRDPLIKNLPPYLNDRFRRFTNTPWLSYFKRHYWIVILSMIIGIIAHLLWDALTHLNLAYPDEGPWTGSRVYISYGLQYISSLIGLAVLAYYINRMPVSLPAARSSGNTAYWPVAIIVAILIAIIEILLAQKINSIVLIEISISSAFASLIIISFFFNRRFKKA